LIVAGIPFFIPPATPLPCPSLSIDLEARGTLGGVPFAPAIGKLEEAEANRMLDELENRSTLRMSSRVKQAARKAIAAIFGGG
jgi:hypothetical protein